MSPAYKVLILVALAACISAFSVWKGYHIGWNDHVIAAEKEKKERAAANQAAITTAEDRYKKRLELAEAQIESLKNVLAENDKAAEADPTALSCGISADSVRRLNAIR